MTDQLERPDPSTFDKFKGEIVAGGSVRENADDDLAGGWRGALSMLVIAGLFVWLGTINLWWLMFVAGIVISVFLHELGHFATAKWTGMKATQFFLFFGPRLWSFRRGETEYGVRAIPLGAFVRIIGMNRMDADVEPGDEGRTYRQKSFPRRLLVISAGSIMHMIIAVVLLFISYLGQGERTDEVVPELYVGSTEKGFAAEQQGILPNDRIVSIGGVPLTDVADLGDVIRTYEPGDTVDFLIIRDDIEQTIPIGLAVRLRLCWDRSVQPVRV
jgi:RIP metalloprotease RseP